MNIIDYMVEEEEQEEQEGEEEEEGEEEKENIWNGRLMELAQGVKRRFS